MMSRLSLCSFLGWALFGRFFVKAVSAQQNLQCSFSDEYPLNEDGTVLMQNYVNYQEGTYSVRLRYTEGYSWIGLGINYYGNSYMVPAHAVIGRMIENTPFIGRYWLERTVLNGVIPIEDPNEHLKTATASFTQQEGETVLEFTHDLIIMEDGIVYENVTSSSSWIWAVGPEDNDWGSRHQLQGSFSISLAETCVDSTSGLSDGNDILPVDLSPAAGDTLDSQNSTDADSDLGTSSTIVFNQSAMQASRGLWITHGLFMGFAWGLCAPLAIGSSLFRNIGFLKKNDLWFKLHMYLNATVAFLTFVGFFLAVRAAKKEGGQGQFKDEIHHNVGLIIFLFVLVQCLLGYFRPHTEENAPKTIEEKEEPNEESMMKETNISKDESTILDTEPFEKAERASACPDENAEEEGFELDMNALAADAEKNKTAKRSKFYWSFFIQPPVSPTPEISEEQKLDDLVAEFEKAGTSMNAPGEDGNEDEKNGTAAHQDNHSWNFFTPSQASPPSETGEEQNLDQLQAKIKGGEISPDKDESEMSKARMLWKITHRVLGVILLSLAWYNCTTGIVLFSEKYNVDNERQLLNVFWGFAATIAVLFLVQGFILRQ
ncbi:cytochrome b561 [Nitzschia inconspicua]|uniref:Cytochrome b561 n=1 Tax=Nitzschia inconspicua TaxID=303405 RepID=A0A9K3KGJ6_9STRA|nr:cytochrome b561 [Nitzschia inconspicua]